MNDGPDVDNVDSAVDSCTCADSIVLSGCLNGTHFDDWPVSVVLETGLSHFPTL